MTGRSSLQQGSSFFFSQPNVADHGHHINNGYAETRLSKSAHPLSLGYGDIAPVSYLGRAIVVVVMIIGTLYISAVTATFGEHLSFTNIEQELMHKVDTRRKLSSTYVHHLLGRLRTSSGSMGSQRLLLAFFRWSCRHTARPCSSVSWQAAFRRRKDDKKLASQHFKKVFDPFTSFCP